MKRALLSIVFVFAASTPVSAQQAYYPQPVYAPSYAPFAQPAPVPREPVTRTRPNLGLIISGAVLLGVGWILDIVTGLPAGDDPFESGSEPEWDAFRFSSLIPLAGPWIQIGVKPTGFTQDYWAPWLILDGLIQATGLTLLVVGLATPRTETTVAVAPMLGPDRAGLSASGRF